MTGTIAERVASLEADNTSAKEDVREIFEQLRKAAEANAETARLQASTQATLDQLTRRVAEQHTPDSCPNTAICKRLDRVYWAGMGIYWLITLLASGGGVVIGRFLLH